MSTISNYIVDWTKVHWKEYANARQIPNEFNERGRATPFPIHVIVPPGEFGTCEEFWLYLIDRISTLAPGRAWHDLFFDRTTDGVTAYLNGRPLLSFSACANSSETHEPPAICPVLILGGKSGAGKTSLLRAIRVKCPDLVRIVPQFTTRPPRATERFGLDYYFVKETCIPSCWPNRYSRPHVVRDKLYWVDRLEELRTVFSRYRAWYTYCQSMRSAVISARARWPRMRYVWICASENDIMQRLVTRSGTELCPSLEYNASVDNSDLADLILNNDSGCFDAIVEDLVAYLSSEL